MLLRKMAFQPAYDVPLSYGLTTVWLRPSLRAASIIEKLDGGFPAVLQNIQQTNLSTVNAVISAAVTSRQDETAILNALADQPLHRIQSATLAPCMALISALMMPSIESGNTTAKPNNNAKPIAWSNLYEDLFKMATGWLGWTPETAWNATLSDIIQAFEGHTDKLKALHGGDETEEGNNAEQQQANVDAGLDPEFDRAGLSALRGMGKLR